MTKTKWAKILYNVSLKNVEAIIDRSEPLVLLVGIKEITNNSKVREVLSLIFKILNNE